MTDLCARDSRIVDELNHELRSLSPEGSVPFDTVTTELGKLLQAEDVLLVKLRHAGAAWTVDFFHSADTARHARVASQLTHFFTNAPKRYAWYNAVSPEPRYRNRTVEAISILPPGWYEASRIRAEFMAPLRFEHHRQLRSLVCDGPALLAWFGAFIPDTVDARQFSIFRRLVPSLGRRLAVEQRLRETPRLSHALEAALDHIDAPAFILGPRGNVREVNTAGRALLASVPTTRASLVDAALGRPSELTCELVPLRQNDRALGWLAIVRGATSAARPLGHLDVSKFAARWLLSPRQAQVLDLLARGASNLRIACELKISERTAEDHVAAILAKAQVGTRSSLIAEMIG